MDLNPQAHRLINGKPLTGKCEVCGGTPIELDLLPWLEICARCNRELVEAGKPREVEVKLFMRQMAKDKPEHAIEIENALRAMFGKDTE